MRGFFESFLPILEKFRQYKIEIGLLLIAIIVIVVSIIASFHSYKSSATQNEVILGKPEASKNIFVDLAGAVVSPGVYEVSSSARLKDLLILAGGLTESADVVFFNHNFNLAKLLNDQEKIYIPTASEVLDGKIFEIKLGDQKAKININTATEAELDTLSGIGQITAQNIIKNRPYSSVEELLSKKVVNKNVYEKIKELISTN